MNFKGKKVIDIGCWDGLWSFEAERRGAAPVLATDYVSQRWPVEETETFLLAQEILGSKVTYRSDVSVYDVPARFPEKDFDIALFMGIYYHLRDPLLAFSRLRQILKTGGTIIIEGEVINDVENCYANFYYAQHYVDDASNWWIPTVRCLREWVESSFFKILSERLSLSRPQKFQRLSRLFGHRITQPGRIVLTAEAVARADPNYTYQDNEFQGFDLNRYGR